MIGALWNGISGLDSFQKALNVETNNIANVSTVGYKADEVTFADMMYQENIGKGSRIQTVDKDFTQGNVKFTGNSYDMSIDGEGFFIVSGDTVENFYTRAGNFKMGDDGTLQTADNRNVMGVSMSAITADNIVSTDVNATQFTSLYDQYLASQIISNDNLTQTINAKTTDYMATVQADDIAMSGNGFKSASSKVSDITLLSNEYREQLSLYATSQDNGIISTPQTSTVTFDKTLLDDTYDRISIFVANNVVSQEFDTDADTTLKKLSDKISALQGFSSSVVIDTNTGELTGGIEIEYLVPGKEFLINDAKINDTSFDINTTAPVAGSGLLAAQSVRDSLKEAVENAGGKFLEITNSVDHPAGTNMPAVSSLQLKLDELGISDRPFGDDIEVDSDGMVYVKQDDYRYVIGKVSTARFNDNYGLKPLGNNVFGKTAVSGDPIQTDSATKIFNSSLELSNADLGESLVNLMVYQRAFEANSKAITTSDEFLNIAIQLKK